MKLKSVIRLALDRDARVGRTVDLRGVENMSAALSCAHRSTPRVLLDYLYEDEIKEFVSGSGYPQQAESTSS